MDKELELAIASVQETAKILEGKVVIDAKVFDGVNARISELEKTNAAAIEKAETLEAEIVTANAKAYVAKTEAEIVAANVAKEAEMAKRKEELKSKGFISEKTIAMALTLSNEQYADYIAALEDAKEVSKAAAIEEAKKTIKANQEEFAAAKDGKEGEQEINLAEGMTSAQKYKTIVSESLKKAKKSK